MAERLTKRIVDAAKAEIKDTYLWDSSLKGFWLKVTPSGRKVYIVQYCIGGRRGRTRRVTLGVHGALMTEEARGLAKNALGQVSIGRLCHINSARCEAPLVEDLWANWCGRNIPFRLSLVPKFSGRCS